jgi:hypothetical protein
MNPVQALLLSAGMTAEAPHPRPQLPTDWDSVELEGLRWRRVLDQARGDSTAGLLSSAYDVRLRRY